MSDDIHSELDFYKDYARHRYDENSIVKFVCRIQKCDKADKFRRSFESFNAPLQFHKDLLDKTKNTRRIDKLLEDVVIKETTYLFNQIKAKSIISTKQDDLYDRVLKEVVDLDTSYKKPKTIVIPRSHATLIPKWNRLDNPKLLDNSYHKLNIAGHTLNVVWPIQQIQLNELILISQDSNVWEFIPQEDDDHSLEVGYELTESLNIPFWVRTTCRLEDVIHDGNIVIENIGVNPS